MAATRVSGVEATTRSDRRKARTAAAILDAAERLFVERGFAATTMEDLSTEADVAIGSIYAHFGSKDGVYGALVERALTVGEGYVEEADGSFGEAPLLRVIGRGEGYLRFARENPHYFRLLRFPPPDRPSEAAAPATELINARTKRETRRMADLIEAAVAEGAIRPLDAETAARYLWSSWDGVIAARLGPSSMNLNEEEFERLLSFAREAVVRSLLGSRGTQFLLDQAAGNSEREKEETP